MLALLNRYETFHRSSESFLLKFSSYVLSKTTEVFSRNAFFRLQREAGVNVILEAMMFGYFIYALQNLKNDVVFELGAA